MTVESCSVMPVRLRMKKYNWGAGVPIADAVSSGELKEKLYLELEILQSRPAWPPLRKQMETVISPEGVPGP